MANFWQKCIGLVLLSIAWHSQAIVDPTEPASKSDIALATTLDINGLALNAIIHQGNQAWVIINGKWLQMGQAINGYTVAAITVDQVFLRKPNGQRLQLWLTQSIRQKGNIA